MLRSLAAAPTPEPNGVSAVCASRPTTTAPVAGGIIAADGVTVCGVFCDTSHAAITATAMARAAIRWGAISRLLAYTPIQCKAHSRALPDGNGTRHARPSTGHVV